MADNNINWRPLAIWVADQTISWEPRSHRGLEGGKLWVFVFYSLGGRRDYKLGAVDSLDGRQYYKLGAAFAFVFEGGNYVFFYSTVWVADRTIHWEPLTVWVADKTINWEPRSLLGLKG